MDGQSSPTDAPLPRLQLWDRQVAPPCRADSSFPLKVSVSVGHPVTDAAIEAAAQDANIWVVCDVLGCVSQLDVKLPHLVETRMPRDVHVSSLAVCHLLVDPVVHGGRLQGGGANRRLLLWS